MRVLHALNCLISLASPAFASDSWSCVCYRDIRSDLFLKFQQMWRLWHWSPTALQLNLDRPFSGGAACLTLGVSPAHPVEEMSENSFIHGHSVIYKFYKNIYPWIWANSKSPFSLRCASVKVQQKVVKDYPITHDNLLQVLRQAASTWLQIVLVAKSLEFSNHPRLIVNAHPLWQACLVLISLTNSYPLQSPCQSLCFQRLRAHWCVIPATSVLLSMRTVQDQIQSYTPKSSYKSHKRTKQTKTEKLPSADKVSASLCTRTATKRDLGEAR